MLAMDRSDEAPRAESQIAEMLRLPPFVANRIRVREFRRRRPRLHGRRAAGGRLVSQLARGAELGSAPFRQWLSAIGVPFRWHRKCWELAYICQALHERGKLRDGARGLGFAVGRERLPSLFAGMGCRITATDLPAEDARTKAWADTAQWALDRDGLWYPDLCDRQTFERDVALRAVDMNDIPGDLRGYDFTWSTCSFEHCGSLALGMDFVVNQMDCLAPGGVAVHTTEFNLTSNRYTTGSGPTCIYRLQDIEALCARLEALSYRVEPLDLDPGTQEIDGHVDLWDPRTRGYSEERHMRLSLNRYACTSIGLIVEKPAADQKKDLN